MHRFLARAAAAMTVAAALCAGALPAQAAVPPRHPHHAKVAAPASKARPKKHAHGLGYTTPTVRRAPSTRLRRSSALPASVDLSQWAVPAGDQGQVGSCVTWAIGYSMLGLYANRMGTPTDFAPMYLYSQIHYSNAADGGGSTSSAAYSVLRSQGIDTQADYTQGNYDWQTPPTAAEQANAAQYRIAGSTTLYTGSGWGDSAKTAIEQQLAAGAPVALAIPIYSSFDSLNSTNWTYRDASVSGSYRGGHMVLIVGYDANGVRIENSWGSSWGQDGFATLGWDFVEDYSLEATASAGFAASTLPAPTAPSVPTSVAVSTTNQSATLTWAPPIANGGSPITGYIATRTYGWTTSSAPVVQTLPATARSTTFSGLSPAIPYLLTVRAVSAAAQGSVRSISAQTGPATVPGAPTGLAVTNDDSTQTLQVGWTAPVDTGGYTPWYTITVTPAGPQTTLLGGGTLASIGPVAPGTTYTITITAVNFAGTGGSASATYAVPLTTPSAVPWATATGGVATAAVTWGVPWRTGGSPVTGYRVQVTSPSGATTTRTVDGGTTSVQLSGLQSGSNTVSVAAVNAQGSSAAVTRTAVVRDPDPVPAPQHVSTSVSGSVLTLHWDSSLGDASPVAWSITVRSAGATLGAYAGASSRSATVYLLGAGDYTVRLQAQNAAADDGTAWTGTVTVSTPLPGSSSSSTGTAAPTGGSSAGGSGSGTAPDPGPGTATDGGASGGVSASQLPGAPGRVWLSGSGRHRAVHWTAPRVQAGAVTGWLVTLRTSGTQRTVQLSSARRTLSFDGLRPGRRYSVVVTATSRSGLGRSGDTAFRIAG